MSLFKKYLSIIQESDEPNSFKLDEEKINILINYYDKERNNINTQGFLDAMSYFTQDIGLGFQGSPKIIFMNVEDKQGTIEAVKNQKLMDFEDSLSRILSFYDSEIAKDKQMKKEFFKELRKVFGKSIQ